MKTGSVVAVPIFSLLLIVFVCGLDTGWAKEKTPEEICWETYERCQTDLYTNPLKPPDTSSPRATLMSFIDSADRAYRIVTTAHRQNMRLPGLTTPDIIKDLGEIAEILPENDVMAVIVEQKGQGSPPAPSSQNRYPCLFRFRHLVRISFSRCRPSVASCLTGA